MLDFSRQTRHLEPHRVCSRTMPLFGYSQQDLDNAYARGFKEGKIVGKVDEFNRQFQRRMKKLRERRKRLQEVQK